MQLHAGKYFSNVYDKINNAWHTNSDGNYWTGWMPHDLPPIELYKHAVSITNDLFVNHPELRQEMMNILIQNQLPKSEEL